jgi:uncharacterized metal-binding protein
MSDIKKSCTNCGTYNCGSRSSNFPPYCLTENIDGQILEEALELYKNDELVSKIAHASAEVEGQYYGQLTRVEEIIVFAKKIGAKKIGIATCVGLIEESKIFAKILKAKGLDFYSVACKVGGVDKNEIGISDENKIKKGGYEALCNPVTQAKILNSEKTDLNVVVGLCVGHDSLFIKYSDAPVTTLITKDRVLAHNPAGALYASCSYYKRLLKKE